MNNCSDCKHADWERAASGRLHPSGDGMCRKGVNIPALPASMYWMNHREPTVFGGAINRRKELQGHCPTFERKPGT